MSAVYLKEIIGLTGTTPPPLAGVSLVNDYPVLDSMFVAASSKLSELDPINNVWDRVLTVAEEEIETNLFNLLSDELTFRQLMVISREAYEGTGLRPQSARYEGARLIFGKEKYTKVLIKNIESSAVGTQTVKCFNLKTGVEVFSVTDLVTDGRIKINKEILLNNLTNDYFIGIDATATDLNGIDGNNGVIIDKCCRYYDVTVTSCSIPIAAPKTVDNIAVSSCFAHVEFEICSSIADFCAKNTYLIKQPALHLVAAKLLDGALESDKFNIYTNTNRNQRGECRAEHIDFYNREMKNILQPVLMRLVTTNIIQDKPADEKLGSSIQDTLAGFGHGHRFGGLRTHNDYPIY